MKAQIQNIELINNYLNKKLSEQESIDFENRLQTDDSFRLLYEEHVILLKGIKRQKLKAEIKRGKQKYIRAKWLRYLGFTSGIIFLVAIVFVYNYFSESNINEPNPPTPIETNKSAIDSVVSKTMIEEIIVEDTLKIKKIDRNLNVLKKKTIAKKEITDIKIPEKASEIVKINANEDTTIVCNEGTKLLVRANSFIDQNDMAVSGEISLSITEYYKLSDILLGNLSTQSDGELLETGGMLFLEAKKGNKKLKLNNKSPIEMSFPNQGDNMQIFSGTWKGNNINWKLQEGKALLEEEVEVIEIEEDNVDVPFSVIEEVPVYPGCESGNNIQRKRCTSQAITEFIQRNFNTQIADNIGLVGRQRINVIFKINEDGEIAEIQARASEPELELEAERVVALLPKMLPGKQRNKVVSVPYALPIVFEANGTSRGRDNRSLIRNRLRDSLNNIRNIRFEARLAERDGSQVTMSEVNRYILRTSELGWINCDRFVNSKNLIKYKLKVNEGKGVIRVNMVFKSMNSVLPSRRSGKNFDFNLVPKDEDIVLVAIKKDEGKLFFDIKDTKTLENPDIEFNFKEVDIETLKKELDKLNKLF